MKYKALMLDVDGTVISYDYNALPSAKLTKAIKNIVDKVAICFVTGRSYYFLKPVLEKININNGYAVVNNGAHVINLSTKDIIRDEPINIKDAKQIINILEGENIPFYVKQGVYDSSYFNVPFRKGQVLKIASMIFAEDVYSSEKIDSIQNKLSHLSNISSYKAQHKNGFGINIQHVNATKLHGVEIVLKALNINSKEAIGVGDSYNDFPLLMACGLKVAMGNAVEDLKVIADYIAPSVDEDGVVDVIEKFILNKEY